LISCVPRLGEPDKQIDAIPGLAPPINRLPAGCAFADRCDFVKSECRMNHIALKEIEAGRTTRCIRVMKSEI
jgi:peptide/nickel transport system permease protein